ncbi:MAG: hypothetical protein CMJ31_12340 [Phycisphaerae bacterium]|nr:hypothetical protein [Phycisphaerae bacterium]
MISFVIPARDRHDELARTLRNIGDLDRDGLGGDAEVIVIDNASFEPLAAPRTLSNGLRVTLERVDTNLGAAARNHGASMANYPWLVMLDDDSSPKARDFAATLAEAPADIGAIGGEIVLPSGERESGGLPEVIIGCGAAVRRDLFLELGGYDASFGYYAEEYDLCARLIATGHRIAHTTSIGFEHRKTKSGRSMDVILGRLVRNNGWTLQRYAPASERAGVIADMIARYRSIAEKEDAVSGFESGLHELQETIDDQPRREMSDDAWARFTGEAAVRAEIGPRVAGAAWRLVDGGKGREIVERVVFEEGGEIDERATQRLVATISPGPMLDACDRDPDAVAPWRVSDRWPVSA